MRGALFGGKITSSIAANRLMKEALVPVNEVPRDVELVREAAPLMLETSASIVVVRAFA